ncbi:sigma-70 family RNA polymerase sigma factor [Vallitalea okinawensis]|uniref:sigma-70 family RNA polymerase sigma factor n=1 Tax=Vallitalea okinawensis TaxID=2078660 RepID=UPI0013004791|nr:sigma-70 family RNA polymerase sigma factor [Vallitalea okinawensis]
MKKAKKGDKESFGQLITLVQDKAYRVAYSYLKNEEDSMDAVCDSVEKAYIKIGGLRNSEYFQTWFMKIVINTSIQLLNKRKKREKIFSTLCDEAVYTTENSIEDNIYIDEILNKMNKRDQKILYLRYWKDEKIKDIAERLNMPINSVKTRLYSSLKSIKNDMEVESNEKKSLSNR